MKKLFSALLIILSISVEIQAQAPNWPTLIQRGTGLLPTRHELDAAGNHYILCDWTSSATLGGQTYTSNSMRSGLLAKYAPDFTLQWVFLIDNANLLATTGLSVDAAGNAVVSGAFSGQLTLGTQTLTATNPGAFTGYIVRISPAGVFTSAREIPATIAGFITDIEPAPNNGLYLAGVYQGVLQFGGQTLSSPTASQGFVALLDSAGNGQWITATTGSDEAVFGRVEVAQNGDILATGHYSGPTQFGAVSLTDPSAQNNSNLVVAKLSSNGTVLWAKQALGKVEYEDNIFVQLKEDAAGNVIVGSSFHMNLSFGSTVLQSGGGAAFMASYDSGGTLQWAQSMTSSAGSALFDFDLDANNNIYASGFFGQNMLVGGTTLTSSAANGSLFVFKLNQLGALLWAQAGNSSLIGGGTSIKVGTAGQLSVLGIFSGTLSMSGSGTLTSLAPSPFEFDMFYASTASLLLTPSLLDKDKGFQFFPNPTSDNLTIILSEEIKAEGAIQILDATGRVLHRQTMKAAGSPLQIELPSLSSGVYLLEVRSGEQVMRQRLIIR